MFKVCVCDLCFLTAACWCDSCCEVDVPSVSVGLSQIRQHIWLLLLSFTSEGLQGVQSHNPGTDLSGLSGPRKGEQTT